MTDRRIELWVSCRRFTVLCIVDKSSKIVDGAPLIRRFKEQPVKNLFRWAAKFGGLEVRYLN